MNQLYPLKFTPIVKEMIWGGNRLKTILNKEIPSDKSGESWEISGVEGNLSVVSNGFLANNNLEELIEIYMGDLVGDAVYEKFGTTFPLLIKFIDANDALSIQVHPDDELAKERHNSFGKTEMWYVVDNEPNAELIVGFNKKVSKEEYVESVKNNTIESILNKEKVSKGDVFFIPAGRVHAIGKGIVIAEIQQTSNITYRIFDFNRTDAKGNPRELHTEQAVDANDYNIYPKYKTDYENVLNKTVNMVDCPYFFTNILKFNQPIEKDYNLIDSFVIYMCIEGSFTIKPIDGEDVVVNKGESILLPAVIKNLTLIPSGKSEVIEVYIK